MRFLMKYRRRRQYLGMFFAVVVTFIIGVDDLKAAKPSNNIVMTVHNLSSGGPAGMKSTDETEICVFCHTPHSSNPTLPLWNHYSTWTGTFKTYSSPTATAAVNSISANLPADSMSRLCLSCHDGTTALNTLVNPGTRGSNPTMTSGASTMKEFYEAQEPQWFEGEYAWLGKNLRNMHPIGFEYDKAELGDSGLNPIDGVRGSNLKLWGPNQNKVECPTCHDPHIYYGCLGFDCAWDVSIDWDNLGYRPFLREKNVSSRLCLTCHDK